MGIVYLLTNTVNGKRYVGQTWGSLYDRVRGHAKDARRIVGKAIRKHGLEAFDSMVLETHKRGADLDEAERFWISAYGTAGAQGYNATSGGETAFRHTDESRRRMSIARAGKPLSEAQRVAIVAANKRRAGRPLSAETRAKLSAAKLAKPSPGFSGCLHTAERKAEIAQQVRERARIAREARR